MNDMPDLLLILRRYFPVFISAFFMAVFSMSLATIINLKLYVADLATQALYLVVTACVLAIYLCLANLLMVRGRPWGVWLVVALLGACIFAVLPTWGYRTPKPMYFLGLLLPLVGLFLLNSKRHRAFRDAMVEVRWQRVAWQKKQRK